MKQSTNTSETKILPRDTNLLPQRHQVSNISRPSAPTKFKKYDTPKKSQDAVLERNLCCSFLSLSGAGSFCLRLFYEHFLDAFSRQTFEMLRAVQYHICNLKNGKNTHGGVLLLVKLQAKACNFTKSGTPPWVFFLCSTENTSDHEEPNSYFFNRSPCHVVNRDISRVHTFSWFYKKFEARDFPSNFLIRGLFPSKSFSRQTSSTNFTRNVKRI